MSNTKKPFIIWTLQRTGGTNLTKYLISLSRLSGKHEPFNQVREYGTITENWLLQKNIDKLHKDINEILEKPQVIKHCVEMVPWRVSDELARISLQKGYESLFLYRKSSVQRLLSMEFSERTKKWGPKSEITSATEEKAFEEELNIPKLIAHESKSIELMNTFWRKVSKRNYKPMSISFESIYESKLPQAISVVNGVLEHLHLSEKIDPEDLVAKLRSTGNQNTRNSYHRFKGISQLEKELKTLPSFAFD